MRYIDPPSRLFSTDSDWLEFLKEMLRYDDAEARKQAEAAKAELELRGVDIKRLTTS